MQGGRRASKSPACSSSPLPEPLGLLPPLAALPRLPAFTLPGGGGWRAPPHEFAWPGQHPTLEPSLTHNSAVEPGRGQAESDGVFFNPYSPPDLIILVLSIGGHLIHPDNASINPSILGSQWPRAMKGSLCSSCPSSLPRPG